MVRNAVAVIERHDQTANDIVEAGAKTAASDDGGDGAGGVEVEFLTRTGALDRDWFGAAFQSWL